MAVHHLLAALFLSAVGLLQIAELVGLVQMQLQLFSMAAMIQHHFLAALVGAALRLHLVTEGLRLEVPLTHISLVTSQRLELAHLAHRQPQAVQGARLMLELPPLVELALLAVLVLLRMYMQVEQIQTSLEMQALEVLAVAAVEHQRRCVLQRLALM